MSETAEIVICGAGIAGISAAYHLAVLRGMRDVVLVDAGDPLSLTSDKSTEAYRNWWPGPGDAMVVLMNRSIDLLEGLAHSTDNRIQLNRRGYLYATADPTKVALFRRLGEEAAGLGAGALRVHGQHDDGRKTIDDSASPSHRPLSIVRGPSSYIPAPAHGFAGQPDGADLILDRALIREHFPYLAEETVAVLHARRCGWLSAQQLGMTMLEQARAHGVRLIRGQVAGVDTAGGRVCCVQVVLKGGASTTIATPRFVNAAGPYLGAVGRMLGVELPVYSERHIKLSFNDHMRAVPREAPMLIWADEVQLPWSDEERAALAEDESTRELLAVQPAGVHCRPEGHGASTSVLILWNRHLDPVEPVFPLPVDDEYAELALRGMAVMLPGLAGYFERAPRPYIDGGYYTKTRENRPLIGPLPVEGAFVLGALSGFGVMAAPAAGELLAAHVMGDALPHYARDFLLARYDDPEYQRLLENWGDVGQL
jgi:glycine/D-amino acid oxidase-like deaminating enzyme